MMCIIYFSNQYVFLQTNYFNSDPVKLVYHAEIKQENMCDGFLLLQKKLLQGESDLDQNCYMR